MEAACAHPFAHAHTHTEGNSPKPLLLTCFKVVLLQLRKHLWSAIHRQRVPLLCFSCLLRCVGQHVSNGLFSRTLTESSLVALGQMDQLLYWCMHRSTKLSVESILNDRCIVIMFLKFSFFDSKKMIWFSILKSFRKLYKPNENPVQTDFNRNSVFQFQKCIFCVEYGRNYYMLENKI